MKIVFTTFASEESAAEVVRQLVEERLVACGTLVPGARSIYTWEGKVEDSRECLVLLKTTRFSELESRLRELHPYELPEIVGVETRALSPAYADWVAACCGHAE